MAEPFRPGVKHVAGEYRQHRRRAAEQDREQIEADRARAPADCGGRSASPSTICAHGLTPRASSLRWTGPMASRLRNANGEQAGAGGVGRIRRPGVKIAAQRRAEDRARLPGDRRQSDGARQDVARDQVRGERAERRPGEGARDAQQRRDDVEDLERRGVLPAANQASAAAQPSSSATDARAIQRRSTRSAVQPVTR